ncbi:MAG: riboflavin biosynthesis protein RibF [Chloroflexota bacterium]
MTPRGAGPARERAGIEALVPDDGPLFLAVGVFDGIHVGHRSLIERLVAEAGRRDARPAVLTFDSHPDALISGEAPPLLVDPGERIRLLEDAGVEVVVVVHFDAELRATTYDRFVERIRARTSLAGFLMTPDAAFGRDRAGTPEAVARLGARDGFDVVIASPLRLDGDKVSSSAIRALIAAGDLAAAARLLGRAYGVVGEPRPGAAGRPALGFPVPVALPPSGGYRVRLGDVRDGEGANAVVTVDREGGTVSLDDATPLVGGGTRIAVTFTG